MKKQKKIRLAVFFFQKKTTTYLTPHRLKKLHAYLFFGVKFWAENFIFFFFRMKQNIFPIIYYLAKVFITYSISIF